MTKILTLVALLVAGTAFAQPVPTPVHGEADKGVREVTDAFIVAWNKHDTAALAAMWTKDGDHTEPDGRTVYGPEHIKQLFDLEHKTVFRNSELNLVVERVRPVTDDVAIADGTYELFHATDPAGNQIGTRTGYFINVMVKEKDGWKVSASRLMLPATLIWRQR
ncbi:MAG: nuclear transport factor 2 family protein [Deltaproteobacteria bacterium]|nr:nuclear transport factor 2 family protein [Deltaproteobacteria bacterium]